MSTTTTTTAPSGAGPAPAGGTPAGRSFYLVTWAAGREW